MLRGGWAGMLLMVLWMVPGTAAAQTVLVRVSDGSTAQPLQGTLVALTDASGSPVRSALTDAQGRYLFAGIIPGSYTLRGELIGYASATQTVTVMAGETTIVDLMLESRAIELEGISIEGEARCEIRPEAGMQVATVWDEVRKALEAARFTSEEGIYEYRTRSYSRNVDEQTGLVTDQQSRRGRVFLNSPYQSRPAEDLMGNGFIQEPSDGSEGEIYFAPDASVLLSDLFLDTHCMHLEAGDDDEAGMVGLAFEPLRGRRISDIAGTLWLDPDTWELSHLEFAYDNIRPTVEVHGVGGRVDFQLLPNGTWIVPRWEIRTPLLALGRDGRGEETVYQFGFHEVGAQVLSIREPGGDVLFSATTAAMEGMVIDMSSGDPVPEAEVSLAGTDTRAFADAEGRFRFTEMLPGRYDVAVLHPETRDYGPAAPTTPAELIAGDLVSVRILMSSPYAFHEAACADAFEARPAGTTLLVGRVVHAETGEGLEGATVNVEWDDFASLERGPGFDRVGTTATTGPDGVYRTCVVPVNSLLRVSAQLGGRSMVVPDTVRVPDRAAGAAHDIRIR